MRRHVLNEILSKTHGTNYSGDSARSSGPWSFCCDNVLPDQRADRLRFAKLELLRQNMCGVGACSLARSSDQPVQPPKLEYERIRKSSLERYSSRFCLTFLRAAMRTSAWTSMIFERGARFMSKFVVRSRQVINSSTGTRGSSHERYAADTTSMFPYCLSLKSASNGTV